MNKWLVLFCLTTVFFAGSCEAYNFRGFYGGVNGGGQITTAEGHAKTSFGFIDLFPNTVRHVEEESLDLYQGTGFGSLYLGYGQTCYAVFMGLEGFINFPKREIRKISTLNYNLDFEEGGDFASIHEKLDHCLWATSRSVEYGIDFKPGCMLTCCTLFYGRVGAAFNRFNFKSKSTAFYEDDSSGFADPSSATASANLCLHKYKQLTGLRLGLGLEHQICGNFGITFDYIYTDYGKVDLFGEAETSERNRVLPNGLEVASCVHLRNHAVLLGISYRFCMSSLIRCCW